MKNENEFLRAKEILDGVDKAIADGEHEKERQVDNKDKKDVSIWRSDKNKSKRERLLDSIVPNRICPSCRNRIWFDKSWVVNGRIAICRSCHYSKSGLVDDGKIKGGFVTQVVVRVEVDGWKILQLRAKGGVGIKAFADRMGYTKAYQYQIENGGLRSMRLEVVERMIGVFEDIGVIVTDAI